MPREEQTAGWNIYKHGGRAGYRHWMPLNGPRRLRALGAGEILLTSMDCDGTKAGYDIELTRAIADACQYSGHCIRRCRNAGTFL